MNKILVSLVVVAVVAVALAGLFGYSYMEYSKTASSYSNLKTSYSNVQASVVLDDAYAHWDYIAIENASLLAPQYASNATLHWIGGPLSGTYTGVQNITNTWDKFFAIWSAVWFYTITPPSVSVSGNMAQVLSMNQFVLTPFSEPQQVQYLNISYTLNYTKSGQNWLITGEVWHIVGTGYISLQEESSLVNQVTAEAFEHWNNIAIENNTSVMQEYLSNATLNWVGGPLNGVYHGYAAINETWNKFFALWSAVWFYTEQPPVVQVSGDMAHVQATVQFVVQNATNTSQFDYINVSYSITYLNTGFQQSSGQMPFMIYMETFQITGKGPLSKV
ncbi:hypothetical protein GCM10007108_05660 [Thermogymnomonas acidicola]|uniref:SnoaL-like domain-containing protein n=1 Tax=Thermogymnomonas acidicola TaxID=399579 RepID=A0AA37F914_9ARCH|nr:hypothetical protein [Thermogymnomonas acidicola]GGM70427.1 hypothetical protein GCM10007108_05660 [Thermogymnomonas acidicola]